MAVQETLDDLRFLLTKAAEGDGINTVMTRKRAMTLKRIFDRKTASSALRSFRFRRRVEPYVMRRVPMRLLTKIANIVPLYG